MTLAHLHLLLNHFPVIGSIIALILLLAAIIGNSNDLKLASLILLLATALITIPTYMSGKAAESDIRQLPNVSQKLIVAHENAALLAYLFMEITGAISWFSLWQFRRNSRFGPRTI